MEQTQTQFDKIQQLYANHDEMPYISPERDLDKWLTEVETSSGKLVPKRNMIRLSEGYLPGHIIILWRVRFGTYTNETVISKYFEHLYGINGKLGMEKLLEDGYVIELGALNSLDQRTAGQLKLYLKDKKVPGLSKMKKDELVAIMPQYFTEEELAPYFTVREYRLTEKGEALLDNHPEVIDKHPKKKY